MVLNMWNIINIFIAVLMLLLFLFPLDFNINILNKNIQLKLYILNKIGIFKKTINISKELKKGTNNNDLVKYKKKIIKYIKENKNKKEEKVLNHVKSNFIKEILRKIYFKKLKLNIKLSNKIFLDSYIVSSYLLTMIYSIIFTYINKNSNKFNLKQNFINIELNNKNYINVKCIIQIKLANIIYIFIKNIIKSYTLYFWKRGLKYVRASYRKFNDYCNEVSRKYD